MSAAAVVEEIETSSNSVRWSVAIAVAVAAVAAAVLASGVLAGRVSTDDAFVEVPMLYVAGQVPGRVIEILAAEHQRVEQGQVLLRLDTAEYELALARSEAALSLARNQVVRAKAAAASADAERSAATVELWRSERELMRVRSLLASNSTSQRDFDTALAAHDAAEARVRAL